MYGMPQLFAASLIESRACFLVPTNRIVPPRPARSAGELLGGVEQALRLLKVDDVDPAALAEYEAAHLGVPAARLVAEMDAGLQQLPDANFGGQRVAPLRFVGERLPAGRLADPGCPGQGRGRCVQRGSLLNGREDSHPPRTCGARVRPRTRRGGPETASLVCLSPRLALRRLAPAGRCQVHDCSSAGGLDSQATISPVNGCLNISFDACRNWRFRPSLRPLSRPPY